MIIALLTDFGTKDYFVGAMKGVILSVNSEAKIVDITHEIEPQNTQSAGLILASCYRNFLPKTIFVAVVDPGVGSKRRAILVETGNHYFIAPDNGLLSLVLVNETNYQVFELTNPKFFLADVSQTFHGRDVFAPVAAWLSKGISPNEFGEEVKDLVLDDSLKPQKVSSKEVEGQIIHVDNFGNLVTNLKKVDLPENFILQLDEKLVSTRQTFYSEAEIGEVFTIWGSAGYLEIVAYRNSAKDLLNVEIGEKVKVKSQ
ncbi:MAG: SAM-dependent chlorinase/fluorinase [Blastocatellia bacterium]|nr:SAM-dependent chlorinase/fluorinase [Blastocatellia bacterium]